MRAKALTRTMPHGISINFLGMLESYVLVMTTLKGIMKSTIAFLQALLTDVGRITNTSIGRDLKTIRSRIENEGESFLTITLPTFAKGLERSLELGYFDQSLFQPFSKVKKSVGIPRLLSGILSKIFDSTGRLRPDVDPILIDGVRQTCLTFNKLKKGCTDDRQKAAIRQYRQCEVDVRSFRPKTWAELPRFKLVFNRLFGQTLGRLQRELLSHELYPAHGPGAVAESFTQNGKYSKQTWSRRLERSFPIADYAIPNYGFEVESVVKGAFSAKSELPVKVVFVPKTQKTPRVIAIEPAHNQYAQQAISRRLMELLEQDTMCKGLHFTSSESNRSIARMASARRDCATLDLSEASDRVHAGLVFHAFDRFPSLAKAIFDCRSKYAKLPDGETIGLSKFASMGSALCFPVESMVFYTLCVMAGFRATGLPVTYRNAWILSSHVHVFGDDLIVPTYWSVALVDLLESARFKVNLSKSFVLGPFRESCGMDAYDGVQVTPVYIRRPFPINKRDHKGIISLVAARNQFYKKGYWETAKYIEEFVGQFFDLPHVAETSPSVGYHSFQNWMQIQRWNSELHRFEFMGKIPKARERKDPVQDGARLLKYFLRSAKNSEPVEVRDFDKSAVRDSATIKSRWTAIG